MFLEFFSGKNNLKICLTYYSEAEIILDLLVLDRLQFLSKKASKIMSNQWAYYDWQERRILVL